MHRRMRIRSVSFLIISLSWLLLLPCGNTADKPRVIEITADKDAKFKIAGQKEPVLTLKANEVVVLRITARKGPEWSKDGAVHSFTVKPLKDLGWDLRLKEGTQDFPLVAPEQPGEYLAECLVLCGPQHEDMRLKVVVTP